MEDQLLREPLVFGSKVPGGSAILGALPRVSDGVLAKAHSVKLCGLIVLMRIGRLNLGVVILDTLLVIVCFLEKCRYAHLDVRVTSDLRWSWRRWRLRLSRVD